MQLTPEEMRKIIYKVLGQFPRGKDQVVACECAAAIVMGELKKSQNLCATEKG